MRTVPVRLPGCRVVKNCWLLAKVNIDSLISAGYSCQSLLPIPTLKDYLKSLWQPCLRVQMASWENTKFVELNWAGCNNVECFGQIGNQLYILVKQGKAVLYLNYITCGKTKTKRLIRYHRLVRHVLITFHVLLIVFRNWSLCG